MSRPRRRAATGAEVRHLARVLGGRVPRPERARYGRCSRRAGGGGPCARPLELLEEPGRLVLACPAHGPVWQPEKPRRKGGAHDER